MRKIVSGILIIIFGCIGCNQEKKENPAVGKIDSVFQSVPDFSGVLLVADKGKPIYFKSFGHKDFNTNIPMDTSAIFELASVSKQFTAVTIMMLKEEGKLDYDDSLKNFIPELPYRGVTVRHLLNHTSGLPDYQGIMDQYWDKSKVAGNEDCIEYLVRYHPPVHFAPGSQFEYSNTGYLLLATIAEKASGKDFIEFLRERVFNSVGMSNTDIRTKEEKLELNNFAWGHIYVPERNAFISADSFPSSNYTIWLGNRKGPGRISSNARDLLKWDQALYRDNLIPPNLLQDAFTPAVLTNDSLSNYGFGWTIEQTSIGKVVRHSGGNPGYSTHIIRYIDANKAIIILCNNAHDKFREILTAIEQIVIDSNQSLD